MDITPLNVQYEDVQGSIGAPGLMVTASSPTSSMPPSASKDSLERVIDPVNSTLPIQYEGYLQKQGRRFHGWHQRWFEIKGQHMLYYKTKAKAHCLGGIDLSICTSVTVSSAATFGQSFEIQTTERSHIMAARTQDEMQAWIYHIQNKMAEREGIKPQKINKVKKWDSFRNAFAIQPRGHSPEPPESRPKATVTRNKSLFDRFKRVKRSPSPSGDVSNGSSGGVIYRRSGRAQSPRPLSAQSDDMRPPLLYPPELNIAGTMSLPATPLVVKREDREGGGYVKAASQSGTSSPLKTSESMTSSRTSTPEHKLESEPSSTTTPSTSPLKPQQETPSPTQDAETNPKPPARSKRTIAKPKTLASPASSLPPILTEESVWDEIRETLDSIPERQNTGISYEELPPLERPWIEKDTPIEQLRAFLAVCD